MMPVGRQSCINFADSREKLWRLGSPSRARSCKARTILCGSSENPNVAVTARAAWCQHARLWLRAGTTKERRGFDDARLYDALGTALARISSHYSSLRKCRQRPWRPRAVARRASPSNSSAPSWSSANPDEHPLKRVATKKRVYIRVVAPFENVCALLV